ncbi:hypothetical protein [Streptomyces niveus]
MTFHRWALISVKPGVGKSTSGIFLAQALHEAALDPLLVDSDKGQSCHRWDELAGGMPFPVISKVSRSLDKTLSPAGPRRVIHRAGADARRVVSPRR